MKKILTILTILCLLAVMLSACKGSSDSGSKFSDLDKILEKQKELKVVLGSINTLDDLKAKKDIYVNLNIDILKMSIASLKKALSISKEDALAYVTKSANLQRKNQALAAELISFNTKLAKIKGGKEYLMEIAKEVGKKTIPMVKEMQQLRQKLKKKIQ